MRYLITGGVGFLGTNLCLRLLSEGHTVVALDDLSTGFKRNLDVLSSHKSFSFLKHDIVNPLPPSLGKFDYIYNLACPASPPRYQKDPIQTFRTCVWGLWNVLNYALPTRTPVFHASTSEVYGDPFEHPQKETHWGHVNPIGARSCYDEGKRAAETLIFDFHRAHDKYPIKVVRIFNTYGPYMDPDDGRVISNFVIQALAGKPLTIYGNGKQTRSFCYVDDMIDGFRAMEKSAPKFIGPLNLGNPCEFTLLELVDTLEKVIGKKLTLKFLDLPSDDPKQRRPDITVANKNIGWAPKIKLEDGLKKTIKHFKEI